MKDTVVMCPTMKIACQECRRFIGRYESLIKSMKHSPFEVTLIDGSVIYFRVETQGELKGYHSKIVYMDDFDDWFSEQLNTLESAT